VAHAPAPLDAVAQERSRRVVERLESASDPDGFLPFDRFMEIALYADEVGYYHQSRSPLGAPGDFYTAAHVSPLFAECVAARVRSVRAATGDPSPFLIVELGPGDGTLAAGIVRALDEEPAGLEYVLVDRSSARARDATARIQDVGASIPVRSAASVGTLGPFRGVVVANEFLDAQPARRLRWDGAVWRELGVRVHDGHVSPAESAMTRGVPGVPLPTSPSSELVLELAPVAEAIVREVADHLTEGEAILIDYGSEESELAGAHSRGTLAAVRGHRFLSDPLDSPGAADLSTFVNFTRIRAAARAGGLTEVAYCSQAEALGAWGFPARLEAALRSAWTSEARVRTQLAAKNLLFGFDRFRVLEVAAPPSAEPRGATT
jgi:SAM-dependent MidA family methyltransferase